MSIKMNHRKLVFQIGSYCMKTNLKFSKTNRNGGLSDHLSQFALDDATLTQNFLVDRRIRLQHFQLLAQGLKIKFLERQKLLKLPEIFFQGNFVIMIFILRKSYFD